MQETICHVRAEMRQSLVSISEMSSLLLASVAVPAGLSLTWSETPKTFSRDEAHFVSHLVHCLHPKPQTQLVGLWVTGGVGSWEWYQNIGY